MVVRHQYAPISFIAAQLVCLGGGGGGACSCAAFLSRPRLVPEPLIPSGLEPDSDFESDSDCEPEHGHFASPIRRARIRGTLRDPDGRGPSQTLPFSWQRTNVVATGNASSPSPGLTRRLFRKCLAKIRLTW
jgi:hypothetical protein